MMWYGSHEGKSGNMVLNIAKYDFNMASKGEYMQIKGELCNKHGKYN